VTLCPFDHLVSIVGKLQRLRFERREAHVWVEF
jgi:hypothetical protein